MSREFGPLEGLSPSQEQIIATLLAREEARHRADEAAGTIARGKATLTEAADGPGAGQANTG